MKCAGETLSVTPGEQQPAWKHARSLARGYSDLSFFVVFVLLLFDCSVWKDSRAVFHHVDNECKTKMTQRIAPLMCHLHLRH